MRALKGSLCAQCWHLAVRGNDRAGSERCPAAGRVPAAPHSQAHRVHACSVHRADAPEVAAFRRCRLGRATLRVLATLVGRVHGPTPVYSNITTQPHRAAWYPVVTALHEVCMQTYPIFSSNERRDTRSLTRSATDSVGSQNGSPADILPGRQPQACPLGRFEPGSATAVRSIAGISGDIVGMQKWREN